MSALDALLAYTLRTHPPSDPLQFRHLARMQGQIGGMSALCFLLYRPRQEEHMSVTRLFSHTLPLLLSQLNRTTQPRRITLHGRTRGRVDWSCTYKGRYAEDNNPALFVCQQSGRQFDHPENQLLRYLLHCIEHCLTRVPPELRRWDAWGPPLPDRPYSVGPALATIAHYLQRTSHNVYLTQVTLPVQVDERHLRAARTSRNLLYQEIVALYELYAHVVDTPVWDRWVDVLNQTLPLPPDGEAVGSLLSAIS
jgi:hypothetical protein